MQVQQWLIGKNLLADVPAQADRTLDQAVFVVGIVAIELAAVDWITGKAANAAVAYDDIARLVFQLLWREVKEQLRLVFAGLGVGIRRHGSRADRQAGNIQQRHVQLRHGTAGWIGGYVRNNGERPIQVLTRRAGTDEMRTVVPVIACAIPIELQVDSSVNAFTTDDRIVVSSSILRAARTDAQLALVVGHELAHANLGHLNKRRINAAIGWIGGAAVDAGITLGGLPIFGVFSKVLAQAGARAFSVAFEREGVQRAGRVAGVANDGALLVDTDGGERVELYGEHVEVVP